jgi:hypothetical protein
MERKHIIAGLALALALPAAAADLSWDWVDLRYTGYDAQNGSGDGVGVSVVKSIGDSVYVIGAYDDLSLEVLGFDVDATLWRVGIGSHRRVSDKIHAFSELTFENAEVGAGIGSADDSGYGFRFGLRGMATDSLELNGGIRYIDVGSTDTLLGFGAVLSIGERFALTTSYEDGDDSFYTFGARYNFD